MTKSTRASAARLKALEILIEAQKRGAFAAQLFESRIDKSPLSKPDKAFTRLLVRGVVSTSGTLDELIDHFARKPASLKPELRCSLQIAVFELIFLRKEGYIAVDQGVELAREVAPRATGLANAILRSVVRVRDRFPFGDPNKGPQALARLCGFPLWLTEKLIAEMGLYEARVFAEASNEAPPQFLAVNAAKATDEEIIELVASFASEKECLEPAGAGHCQVPGCYRLLDAGLLNDGRLRRAFAQGKILISDAASQTVASLSLPKSKPQSFLEIGAGRATKTLLIQNQALRRWSSQIDDYTALDSHGFKVELLERRCEAYGIEVAQALTGDACHLDRLVGDKNYETIFIDAPCSGLGTLRRHPEIRWRITPKTIQDCASLGLRLLMSASQHLKPGGRLVYSTCTITPEENQEVIKAFLRSPEGACFELVPVGDAIGKGHGHEGSICESSGYEDGVCENGVCESDICESDICESEICESDICESDFHEDGFWSSRLSSGSPDAHFAAVLQRLSFQRL